MDKSHWLENVACPDCTSSDGLAIYDDGHTHCYVCGKTTQPERNDQYFKDQTPMRDNYCWAEGHRGISAETLSRYKVVTQGDNIYFQHKEGSKVRTPGKSYRVEGELQPLWGMHIKSVAPYLVITEGEYDCLTAAEVLDPMVFHACSLPNGSNSTGKILKDPAYLSIFKHVFICCDSDKPGQEAAKRLDEGMQVPHTILFAPPPYKDLNEWLQAGAAEGMQQLFETAVQEAKTVLPPTSFGADDFCSMLAKPRYKAEGYSTGYSTLDKLIGGWRPGEVITIVAGTGTGKSTFMRSLAYKFGTTSQHDGTALIVTLEDYPRLAGYALADMNAGEPLSKRYSDELIDQGVKEHKDIKQRMLASARSVFNLVRIMNTEAITNWDTLKLGIIAELEKYGHKLVMIDHLSYIRTLYSHSFSDDRDIEGHVMAALNKIANEYSCTIVTAVHMNRDQQDPDDTRPNLARIKNSTSVAQQSYGVLGLSRQRQRQDEQKPLTTITSLKPMRYFQPDPNAPWQVFLELDFQRSRQLLVPAQNEDSPLIKFRSFVNNP